MSHDRRNRRRLEFRAPHGQDQSVLRKEHKLVFIYLGQSSFGGQNKGTRYFLSFFFFFPVVFFSRKRVSKGTYLGDLAMKRQPGQPWTFWLQPSRCLTRHRAWRGHGILGFRAWPRASTEPLPRRSKPQKDKSPALFQ